MNEGGRRKRAPAFAREAFDAVASDNERNAASGFRSLSQPLTQSQSASQNAMPTDPARESAQRAPRSDALAWPGGAWTYGELDARADTLAAALRSRGLASGDRLALHARATPDAVALLWACWRAGIVLAPIGPRWPAAAAEERAAAIGAALLLGDGDLTDLVSNLSRPTPHIPQEPPRAARTAAGQVSPQTIIWTSGSSGAPKAAVHSARNHIASARGVVPLIGLGGGSRYLLTLPLASVGGLAVAVRCALAGATVVLPGARETPSEAMHRAEVTHVSLVGTHLVRLLGDARADASLARLRGVLLGGSAIPPSALEECARRGVRVAPGYGLTEMASTVTAVAPGAGTDALGTAGRVLPHRAVRVGAGGEIEVHGATRFLGYLEADTDAPGCAVLREPFGACGWFATGDLGALDSDGRLRVSGRRGNRFTSGGANVQPEAIEAVLQAHPEVRRAVVVPVAHAEFGHRPVALIEASTAEPGQALPRALLAELDRAVRARLPGYMTPDTYHPLPGGMTLSGSAKPDRAALRRFAESPPG